MALQKDNPNTWYLAAKYLQGRRKGCVAHYRRESKRESSIDNISPSLQSVSNTVPSWQRYFIFIECFLFCGDECPETSTSELRAQGTRHHHLTVRNTVALLCSWKSMSQHRATWQHASQSCACAAKAQEQGGSSPESVVCTDAWHYSPKYSMKHNTQMGNTSLLNMVAIECHILSILKHRVMLLAPRLLMKPQ